MIAIAAGLVALPAIAVAAADAPLRIISIDVEGGAATLYVTPQGHALLIDTGWPAGRGGARGAPGAAPAPPPLSSALRIVAAARAAGVTKLDYLVISHYHVDHVGGVHELLAAMPVDTIVDHGPNRETPALDLAPERMPSQPLALYPKYAEAVAGRKHRVLKAGQNLKLDDLVFTAVTSDAERIARPLAGAGAPGAGCAQATSKAGTDNGGEENVRSVGMVAQWGRARILALADTPWDQENALVCPVNRIGRVDLMFADDHGSDVGSSPALLNSVQPTVVLMNNGSTKGAAGPALDRVTAVTGPQGLWQLHFATRTPDKNAPADQIANIDGPDAMAAITVAVDKRGSVTLTNGRNGFSRTYGPSLR
jgi:beta-lactamase superfamily II metal-dependent hydrolase